MINDKLLDDDVQRDLLGAAVRFYELKLYDHCIMILNILMKNDNKESFVLAGHCLSSSGGKYLNDAAAKYYSISCELGSAVGCYNAYLSYKDLDEECSEVYLKKAIDLGWDNLSNGG